MEEIAESMEEVRGMVRATDLALRLVFGREAEVPLSVEAVVTTDSGEPKRSSFRSCPTLMFSFSRDLPPSFRTEVCCAFEVEKLGSSLVPVASETVLLVSRVCRLPASVANGEGR